MWHLFFSFSYGGRLVLICIVLTSLLMFMVSLFEFPEGRGRKWNIITAPDFVMSIIQKYEWPIGILFVNPKIKVDLDLKFSRLKTNAYSFFELVRAPECPISFHSKAVYREKYKPLCSQNRGCSENRALSVAMSRIRTVKGRLRGKHSLSLVSTIMCYSINFPTNMMNFEPKGSS